MWKETWSTWVPAKPPSFFRPYARKDGRRRLFGQTVSGGFDGPRSNGLQWSMLIPPSRSLTPPARSHDGIDSARIGWAFLSQASLDKSDLPSVRMGGP